MNNSIPCLHLRPGQLLNAHEIDTPSTSDIEFMAGDSLAQGRTYHLHDPALGYAVGTCAADNRDVEIQALAHHEFTHITEGEVVLHSDGAAPVTLKAGDAAVIPKGTPVRWQQSGPVKRTFMVFADEEGPEENAPRTVIRIDTQAELAPSAPPLADLVISTPAPEASNRNVFLARDGKLRIGLWECTAYARTETKPAYSELMQILSGSVTLSQPDRAWSAKAGETLVVPANAECRWTSNETVRKIFCIIG